MDEALRLLQPLPDMLRKLFADSLPVKALAGIVAAILDYLLPVAASRDLAIAAGVLILLDTGTGFWASMVSGKKISSAKFSRVLTNLLGYGSVVVVCGIATRSVPGAVALQPTALSFVLGFVILTESISILENVGKMGVKTPPFLKQWLKDRLKDKPNEE